jgi:hypothetical protein
MKTCAAILALILSVNNAYCQALKKYKVDNSGCLAYFLCNPGAFDHSKSPDSADVYTGECTLNDLDYGLICVKLKEPISDLKISEDVLVQYLDYLKTTLGIVSARGYGKGHLLKNNKKITGIVDYWKDKEENNWKVKGWTNGKYIAVLYVNSKNEIPEAKADVFLDGLVFPGM